MEKKIITKHWHDPEQKSLEGYKKNGGYSALEKAYGMEPSEILAEVKASSLRERDRHGQLCIAKWAAIPKNTDKPKYVVCNAAESEPGTFKDRTILLRDPHAVLEGIALTCWAIQANHAYVFVRGEFAHASEVMQAAIDEAYEAGIFGKNSMDKGFALECTLHRGAGSYVCTEDSALLESLEGKKALPRNILPLLTTSGLFGAPTVVSNVETLATLPWIVENGGEKYAELGTEKSKGTRLVCISGPVNSPGVYEVELGASLQKCIDELAGGVQGGRRIRAVIPGGSSSIPLTIEELEGAELSYESLEELGSSLGTAGVIVIPEDFCVVESMAVIARFYHDESCGQCTPCREGTGWLSRLLWRIMRGEGTQEDLPMLSHISHGMAGKNLCDLADSVAAPMLRFLEIFREDFEKKLRTN